MAVRFTWDPRKAAANLRKHHVSFEEAASVFADPLALAVEDMVDPERTVPIGVSDRRRVLLTVYAEIDEDTIRIQRSPRDLARKDAMKKTRRQQEPSHASLREIPEVDFRAAKVQRNPYAERIAAQGIVVGRGRPRKGEETGPTIPRSIRFPAPVWERLEKRAKAEGITLHAALRAAILEWAGH